MISRILPFVFLFLGKLIPAVSQDLSAYINSKHGLDYELINGTQFYYQYHRVQGHPFYISENLVTGMVVQKDNIYPDVRINYDIYAQHLILEFQGNHVGTQRVILPPVHTDGFELDGYMFKKLNLDEKGPLFFQLIQVNGLTCYIHWKKELGPATNTRDYMDAFSYPVLTYYLEYKNELHPFKNRKTFAAPFPDIHKRRIKKYLRRNMIRFKRATPEQMEGLLEYASSLALDTPCK